MKLPDLHPDDLHLLAYMERAGCLDLPTLALDPGELCPRLPEESDQARAAFLAFLELDLSSRSLPALAQVLGKSLSLLKRWSARHKWQERAYPYDMALIKTESAARTLARILQEQERHRGYRERAAAQDRASYQARLDGIARKKAAGELHPASVPKRERALYVARFPQWADELHRVERLCREASWRRSR